MTPRQLHDLRVLYHLTLLTDLTVRNTTLLQTLSMRMDGKADATIQDGAMAAGKIIEQVARYSEKFLLSGGPEPAAQRHLNADEFRDIAEKMKAFASAFAADGF